ncbi:hypothetical protein [Acinetobacter sp.]|uniref:hypothetical protein n=1 Tax=Acinetobacter sp. TaxID=472 RepID=UPI0028AE4F61|nr:hypothetical protein [Acinetobacter sp.]
MPKILILKEVTAKSSCGTKIIVEQVFEKILNQSGLIWLPLPKIVITEKIIDLNENNFFTHPATGKVFEVMNEKERFKFKRKTQPLY